MRSSLRKTGRPVHAMVEQLEGRMLLSAWAGTWKVKGIEFDASPAQPNGEASFKAMTISAVIKDVAPGQYELTVPAYGYMVMLTGDVTEIGQWQSNPSVESYMRLRMVDPGVILAVHAEAGYETDVRANRNSVSWANFFSGIGTQKAAPAVKSAWNGQYTGHGTSFEFGWDGQAYGSQLSTDDQPTSVSIVQTGWRQYTAGADGDPNLATYNESGGKLIHGYVGPDSQGGDRYLHRYEQIWRGPYGRIYHFGGVAEFGWPGRSGELVSGRLDATYSDPHVNIAPVLDRSGAPAFDAIDEDDGTNTGTTVADLLAGPGSTYIYDPNSADARGIAVVGTDTKRGAWQYSLDGSTWQDVGKVTGASALLLDSTARLRFVPKANYFGTLSKAITFRAWDESDVLVHPNGGRAPVNASGKTTAFSKATDVASLVVNPVNDAPTLVGFDVPLTHILGGPAVSVGAGMKLVDVDSKMLSSATITFAGSLVAGEDLIAYRAVTGITGSFDAATNTLTLSGVATLSRYLAALKAVSFKVAAATSSAPTRTITFTLADELGEVSLSVDRLLQITA